MLSINCYNFKLYEYFTRDNICHSSNAQYLNFNTSKRYSIQIKPPTFENGNINLTTIQYDMLIQLSCILCPFLESGMWFKLQIIMH